MKWGLVALVLYFILVPLTAKAILFSNQGTVAAILLTNSSNTVLFTASSGNILFTWP